ncbi:substrate-binding periplasmic protein [Aquitalea aquatica]|uniref:Transporter substrate-binding domain-containing protein n=1 Tax=Aquitalea aquatica TaxID=3044273 RepID=A0A838YBJ6_9NEIS|nr:transporter substrate-binding domain-containing protein [Aquitalea magnusonii]MBA4708405.1 transporter substrate-binding domain-containing protein [Aquitalea magnusonii]
MVRLNKTWLALLTGAALAQAAAANGILKIGVSDSDAPPIVVLTPDNQALAGGLTKELGDALAGELGLKAQYVVIARKRVESTIEAGRVNIVCNANPEWYGNATRLGWTREFYPQVERALSLKDMPDLHQTDEMVGKRIGTIRGYSYPTLEHLWAVGRTTRVDESRLELLVKSLQKKLTDVAISSELELAWWAKTNPQEARAFKQHPMTVTYMPTMCAVAPNSSVSTDKLNQGIEAMRRSGKLKAILKAYEWQTQ